MPQLSPLRQAKELLSKKLDTQPRYQILIDTLDTIGDRLKPENKPLIKIVSPSAPLAKSLLTKHQANAELRSLYQFETVAPISKIRQILDNCDLICLIYSEKQEIRDHHYKLIELAQKQSIDLLILVQKSKANSDITKTDNWQQNLDDFGDILLPLSCNCLIDLDLPSELDLYQRSLINLAPQIINNRQSRIIHEILQAVRSFFNQETTDLWQAIKQINADYFAGQPLHLYQQTFRQDIQSLNQFRQQLVRDIKQAVNHEKTDLLNPFAIDGLIFNFQQLINSAEVKIVTEPGNSYLHLILTQFAQQPLLREYILELCQQRVDDILVQQWSKINSVYGTGGLELLLERSEAELAKIKPLLDVEFPISFSLVAAPSLDIQQVIDPYCLEINSRIPFDYSFTQSSWFRLFISTLVGMAIYLSTWLYLGTGKYIGFMIIIFQIINLITGQSIKKNKLKQQTKELKRIADQKYQSLVRTIVSYLAQTITVAVDQASQSHQQQYNQAIAIAQNKLEELRETNETHKATIEKLKQDRDRVIAYFDQLTG
ncbi:MAG: hypothetical protein AAFO95_03305 [Cyanobacteria bacterium J06600_6]